MDTHDLPLHGVTATHLEPPAPDAVAALTEALESCDRGRALRVVAAAHPKLLAAWALLAEEALGGGDPVAAYAFARTGYHRGLDAARSAGWRGQGPIPSDHEPNAGFLRSVDALRRAAEAIGEDEEALRCRTFLVELDPGGTFDPRR